MKSWLQDNNLELYSIQKEGKSVVAGRVVITLKNKTNKYMTSILKNVYIDKLDDIVSKYNNTYRVPTSSEKDFVIKKGKNIVPWTNVVSDFEGRKTAGTCYRKELQKTKTKIRIATNITLNAEINEFKDEIPSINNT